MDDTAFRDLIDVMLSELCDTEFRDLYPPGVLCPEHQEISTRFPHAEVLVDQVVDHKANGGNVALGETMGELFLQSYFSVRPPAYIADSAHTWIWMRCLLACSVELQA